ncbi:MAG: hypothetical protein R3E12_07045 [Candidatus Eisenbacteria bacterium]
MNCDGTPILASWELEATPGMRIKICCIQNEDEARLAIRHGADAIGLVSRMPSGSRRDLTNGIAEIVGSVDGSVETFLLDF